MGVRFGRGGCGPVGSDAGMMPVTRTEVRQGCRRASFMEGGIMALVLTRGLNESILIGGAEIRITVVRINAGADKVRLAIEAPRDIDIVRAELAQNDAAAVAAAGGGSNVGA